MLVLVVACGREPQKAASSREPQETASAAVANPAPTLHSWDLILDESDLSEYGTSIKKESSDDHADKEEEGDSSTWTYSHHVFDTRLGPILINLYVYKLPDYAKQQMADEYAYTQVRYVKKTPDGASLRHYSSNPADTIEEYAFWRREIPLSETFGDQSFCTQWKTFSPFLWFRHGNVTILLQVGSFGTEHLPQTMRIARMQEAKLRRLLGEKSGAR